MASRLTEYVLKGVYLGLLLLAAVQERTWTALATVFGCMILGLALALAVAAAAKLREGYRVGGRLAAFLLYLLLESPGLVYAGVIGGTLAGVYLGVPEVGKGGGRPLVAAVGGGAALGLVFALLRGVQYRPVRLGLSLLLAAGLVVGVL